MNGTYKVNVTDKTIDGQLIASDGKTSIHLPYTVENDKLDLYNNGGDAFVKQ